MLRLFRPTKLDRFIQRLKEKDPTLTEIDLDGKGIGDGGASKLAKALKGNATVTYLDLDDNRIGDKGGKALAEALSGNSTLTELSLYYNSIGDEGGKALAEVLRENSTLTKLNLYSNSIGEEGGKALAEALRNNSTLTKLNLDGNNIGDEGGKALAEALHYNSTLNWLNLEGNSVGPEGGKALAEALRNNSTLTWLSLESNSIGDEGGKALAEALRLDSTLTELYLNRNSIGAEGGKALAGALHDNSTLTKLWLGSNNIGEEGGTALAEALSGNSTLTELCLRNNSIGDEGGMAFAEALRINSTLTWLLLDENNIGDKLLQQISRLIEINKELSTPQEAARRKETEFGPSTIGALRRKKKDDEVALPMSEQVEKLRIVDDATRGAQEDEERRRQLKEERERREVEERRRRQEEAKRQEEEEERRRHKLQTEKEMREAKEQRRRQAEAKRREEEEEKRRRKLQEEAERNEQDRKESARCDAEQKHEAEMVIDSMDDIRIQIRSVIAKQRQDPVEVSPEYLKRIRTDCFLGKGFYGKVYKGFDKVLGEEFAIKVADSEALEGATARRVDGVQMSFQNEMNVLSKLNHPSIARLYGYCIPSKGMEDMCLIYELATNGSLDSFWEDDLGRERLSTGKVRIKIAYEVATALQYMHEGLDWDDICYHRDIKSANICLAADFSARVIDCGLSKYVVENEESFSSAGATGTKGYICPEYNDGDIKFQSPCDVFSFGVLLCELITGRTSCHGAHHYSVYEKKKSRNLRQDADKSVNWGDDRTLDRIVNLASNCIKPESSARPLISQVVEDLRGLLAATESNHCKNLSTMGARGGVSKKCRICGSYSTEYVKCHGRTQHIHCANCIEDRLIENNTFMRQHIFSCLRDDCDSRDFHDDEVMGLISHNAWTAYQMQKHSAAVIDNLASRIGSYSLQTDQLIARSFGDTNDRIDTSLRLQAQLCAGNGLPCPRRFLLIEADRPRNVRQHPREWAKNRGSTKLYLYFVCSHSLKVVSDDNRVKLRYSREWVKKIAPAYNMSLIMLKAAASCAQIGDLPLELARLEEMDEWVKGILDPRDREVMKRANPNDWKLNDEEIQTLVGQSLSLVAEKAASENINWQNELVPAFDFEQGQATFIKREYLMHDRYSKWQGNPNS